MAALIAFSAAIGEYASKLSISRTFPNSGAHRRTGSPVRPSVPFGAVAVAAHPVAKELRQPNGENVVVITGDHVAGINLDQFCRRHQIDEFRSALCR